MNQSEKRETWKKNLAKLREVKSHKKARFLIEKNKEINDIEQQVKFNNEFKYLNILDMASIDKKLDNVKESGNSYEADVEDILIALKKRAPKELVYITGSALDKISEMKREFPNFSKPLAYIEKHITFSYLRGKPLSLPPINLDGEPGIGKTLFSKKLAECFNTDMLKIDISQLVSNHELFGLSDKWSNPSKGMLFQRIVDETDKAQPVVLIDEVCKASKEGAKGSSSVMTGLLTIFERETAKSVRDNFLDINYDVSNAVYLSTTNEFDSLTEPLKSRLLNFKIEKPNEEEFKIIAQNMYNQILDEHELNEDFVPKLNKTIYDEIKDLDLRSVRKILESAVISVYIKERLKDDDDRRIQLNKTVIKSELNGVSKTKKSIGFV